MYDAWDHERGANNVVIQVVDSGMIITHPDMASALWQNPGEICGNGIDDDNNGYTDDCNGQCRDFFELTRTLFRPTFFF